MLGLQAIIYAQADLLAVCPEADMTTYIMLINWTDRGARRADQAPQRLDAARAMLEDMAGSIRSVYLTMGGYDLVAIVEAPDDAVMARFTLQLGMLGNVRTQTLKAFPEKAYREIVASLQ
jgi:uncharacterized protein with GYD domain